MNKILIDLPEVIETPRLLLQMPKAGFGAKIHEAILDGYEDYARWLKFPTTLPSIQDVEEDCRKHHAEFIMREWIKYLIIEKISGEVIGRCGYLPFQSNWAVPQFSIHYLIRKAQRNKGFATEITHALTRLAFKTLKARKVELHIDQENTASAKIPPKLNYTLEYTYRGGMLRPDDALAVFNVFSIFSSDDLPYMEIKY